MSQSDIHIRLATIKDLPDIQRCVKLAYTTYIERMEQEPAPMRADFSQLISLHRVSVATIDQAFAGFVVFYERGDHIHLENVAVQPALSGHGIGRSLFAYVEQQAISKGFSKIELYTNEMMHENFGLYKHLGYVEIDRQEEDGFNRVFFSKTL